MPTCRLDHAAWIAGHGGCGGAARAADSRPYERTGGQVWRGVGTPPYGPGRKHGVGAAFMAARKRPRFAPRPRSTDRARRGLFPQLDDLVAEDGGVFEFHHPGGLAHGLFQPAISRSFSALVILTPDLPRTSSVGLEISIRSRTDLTMVLGTMPWAWL